MVFFNIYLHPGIYSYELIFYLRFKIQEIEVTLIQTIVRFIKFIYKSITNNVVYRINREKLPNYISFNVPTDANQ